MTGAEYVVLFVCVTIMEFGIPGPGDASFLAAGTLAGEGRLNVGIVFVVSAGRVDGQFGHRVRGRAPRGTPASRQSLGLGGAGFPRNWGRVRGAGDHGPALLATGVLPVRRPAP